jgi:hypothetical protein
MLRANEKRLKVSVHPGMFSSERYVEFKSGRMSPLIPDIEEVLGLFVDEGDVVDDTIPIYVIGIRDDEAIVDLPRDTWTTGNRVRILASLIL